jgi:hypothetical protein
MKNELTMTAAALAMVATLAMPAIAMATTAPQTLAQTAPPPPPPPPATDLAPPPMAPASPPAPAPEPTGVDKTIHTGIALRVGGRLQNGTDLSKMNDFGIDEMTLELRFSGQLMPMFAWQANFNAVRGGVGVPLTDGPGGNWNANIQDIIGKVEPMDELHIWVGRMLVPSDRSNFSGPWFMSAWNYPGFYPTITAGPVGPKQGPFGRNNGFTVWGDVMKGKFKYYVGVFDLDNTNARPLFTSRFNYCLLGSEPGYYHSSTYYGSQDIVAVSAGLQYQKDGFSTPMVAHDLTIFYADVLAEKNLGSGVGTLEGQYYHFSEGYQNNINNAFFVLGSFLINQKVGIGRIQPLLRWQQTSSTNGGTSWKMLDVFASYVIDEYFLRFAVGYQREDVGLPTGAGNAIQIGLQMQR